MWLTIHRITKDYIILALNMEKIQMQSVMCQALLTHYAESHWEPIGCLLRQIGEYTTCRVFPLTGACHCDVIDEPFVTQGEAGSTSPSSLPSLEPPFSSSIKSIYYSAPLPPTAAGLIPFMLPLFFPEVIPNIVIEGESTLMPAMLASLSKDTIMFGEVIQGEVFERIPLLGSEGWYS